MTQRPRTLPISMAGLRPVRRAGAVWRRAGPRVSLETLAAVVGVLGAVAGAWLVLEPRVITVGYARGGYDIDGTHLVSLGNGVFSAPPRWRWSMWRARSALLAL